MKYQTFQLYISLLPLWFIVPNYLTAQVPGVGHVVVIGVDGMSPDGIQNAHTPHIDHMMEEGAHTMTARAVLPSSSSPNWASMLMAAGPEQHGITSNSWRRDHFLLPPTVYGVEDIFPTIFGVIRDQIPAAVTGAIYDWGGIANLLEPTVIDVNIDAHGPDTTTMEAVSFIEASKPTYTFIHLDHVDGAGHDRNHGHGSPGYYKAVSKADSLIGEILGALKAADLMDKSIVIVSADHGGIGYGHGGETPSEMEIPFILFGKHVKGGYPIRSSVNTYDNAATVAYILGLTPPAAWIGTPVKEAFTTYTTPSFPAKHSLLSVPMISPHTSLFIDQHPTIYLSHPSSKAAIHYTMDGTEPDSTSPLYEKPFNLSSSALIKAKAFQDDLSSMTVSQDISIVDSHGNHGLTYTFYEGTGKWKSIPNLDKLPAKAKGKVYRIGLTEIQEDHFQFFVRFQGVLRIDTSANYHFHLTSDDGSMLYLDEKVVINHDGEHGESTKSGEIYLTAGLHPIRIDYFQAGGGKMLKLTYGLQGEEAREIPADKLMIEE